MGDRVSNAAKDETIVVPDPSSKHAVSRVDVPIASGRRALGGAWTRRTVGVDTTALTRSECAVAAAARCDGALNQEVMDASVRNGSRGRGGGEPAVLGG